MDLSITFRHVQPTDALKAYVVERMKRVERHLAQGGAQGGVAGGSVHVVLDLERREHQVAEVVLHCSAQVFVAKAATTELYSAIDAAIAKLDEQVRRQHGRQNGARRRHGGLRDELTALVS